MRLKQGTILSLLDFDSVYCLFNLPNAHILAQYFRLLDCHQKNTLNDGQFNHFMRHTTDARPDEVMTIFDMLDWDTTGEIDFEHFYLLVCIMLCNEFRVQNKFVFRHCRTVFELLDVDGSRDISRTEFQSYGFLFSLTKRAVTELFDQVDISGDKRIDYEEFRLFILQAVKMQQETKEAKEESQVGGIYNTFLKKLKPRVVHPDTPEPRVDHPDSPEPRVVHPDTPEPRVDHPDTPEPRVVHSDSPEPRVDHSDSPEPSVDHSDSPEPSVDHPNRCHTPFVSEDRKKATVDTTDSGKGFSSPREKSCKEWRIEDLHSISATPSTSCEVAMETVEVQKNKKKQSRVKRLYNSFLKKLKTCCCCSLDTDALD